MSSVLLYHPLGLGDHIICNAIVREYAKTHTRVGLFCFAQNYTSVSFMYRDLSNVRVHAIRSQKEIFWFRYKHWLRGTRYDSFKTIGVMNAESGVIFERQFYQSAGVNFDKKWSGFHFERDTAREETLFAKLPTQAPYIFLHDDARFPADQSRIGTGKTVVRPAKDLTDNIFDYSLVLERADELHVIDSSFMFLIDCLPYKNPSQKLFIHRYIRENAPWNLPILQKNWQVLH